MLGAGPIGLELAQVYNRLGAQVTVLEMADRVLPREDPEAAAVVRDAMETEGVRFVLGERADRVEAGPEGKTVITDTGQRILSDEIFVATGRRPATQSLALEEAGVEVERGAVKVDDTLATTSRGIWAAGDVVAGPMFTHVADYQAKAVLQNAIFPLKKRVDYSRVPRVTYTDPELAHVGMGPEEARAEGGQESRYAFSDLDRAITDGNTAGFVRVWTGKRGRILCATIVGADAGELLLPFILAMDNDIPLQRLSQSIFPYPTRMEGLKRAADGYRKAQLTDSRAGTILRKVVSWLT
jgi:pyruvate/2-oxoglutarate dehydrogenase complex dihydrolipoamide dehydrogenase (E3) component